MVLRSGTVLSCHALQDHLEILAQKAKDLDSRGIKETLQEIVPEYVPDYSV
jgi:hypothetical protein